MSTHQHNLRSKNPKKNYHNIDTISEPELIRQTYGPEASNTATSDETQTNNDRNNKKLKTSSEEPSNIDNMNIHYLDKSNGNFYFVNYSKLYIIIILEILIYDVRDLKEHIFKIS
jgi:hypothetical protein